MNPDLERLHPYPFEKLGTLFADLPASDKSPVAFSIGEPQHPAPDFVQQALRDNTALLAKYPELRCTAEEALRRLAPIDGNLGASLCRSERPGWPHGYLGIH